jgi:hypothetical protein
MKLAEKLLLDLATVCPWSLPIEYLEILGGKEVRGKGFTGSGTCF